MTTQTTAANGSQFEHPSFDLSNPQHLAMRKVIADLHWKHAAALQRGVLTTAARYRGMASGLEKAARFILKDDDLSWFCFRLVCSFEDMEELYRKRVGA
ncbi:hypothetical protein [Shewanella algidipiscicola]|uniref:Uncharacterized protein n=1 Tax=Shewanella algidipiscicola TaxID=614070 RepID=A0ABQ4PD24_9GAMM|nr:hypothetical protein [Shewanella algidipiscicola]GIU45462.1 hypothetical protein TUM4630_13620 [Shewanella algidipiscicola]